MSSEEFQKLALEKFDKLDSDITEIKTDIADIKHTLKATYKQITILTEQITEIR